MQKVYLLRNNQKSGPFTLPELWQQSPQLSDMIWIDGKSTAWTRLSELELSMPAAPDEPMPETAVDLESKAEALRKRALEVPPRVFTRTPAARHYETAPAEETEEPILFIDHRKEKKNILGEVLMTLFIIALLGGGLLGGRSLFRPRASAAAPVVTRINTRDEHAAQSPQPVAATPVMNMQDTQASLAVAPVPPPTIVHKEVVKKAPETQVTPVQPSPAPDSEKLVREQDVPKAVAKAPEHTEEKEKVKEEPKVQTPATTDESSEPQKKKGLGQAIRNLFHKKKKSD